MAKKSRRASAPRPTSDVDVPVVGPREPCPCGSGKRYKVCHGRRAQNDEVTLVHRPFQGLPAEGDWVAMRELVPAATATARLNQEHGGEEVTIATVLPMAWAAMRRQDGALFAGLQVQGSSGDPSRDVASALLQVVDAEPGTPVEGVGRPGPGPRLQDVLDDSVPFTVSVQSGFDFWLDGSDADRSPEVQASMERASSMVVPTERLTTVESAYWARIGEKEHLRWALPYDEEPLLDAIARLHARGASGLGEGSRYVGAFRAHGLLVPVWDLARGSSVDDVEEPAAAFSERLQAVLDDPQPLTADERRARAGVVSRQLTLR